MLHLIKKSLHEGKLGTQDLYSKIPYFLRTKLDGVISKIRWATVKDGCNQQKPGSIEEARQIYTFLLQKIDEYISTQQLDESTSMIVVKNNIKIEFQDDAVRFVSEMANCLEKERELIYINQEPEHMESEGTGDAEVSMVVADDQELCDLEQLLYETESQLNQAKNYIVDQNKFSEIPMAVIQFLSQDHTVTDTNPNLGDIQDEVRAYMAEYASWHSNQEQQISQLQDCKQKILDGLSQIYQRCGPYTEKLATEIKNWKAAEAKRSVKVGPEPDTASLIRMFKRFGDVVSSVLKWFSEQGQLYFIREKEQILTPEQEYFCIQIAKVEKNLKDIKNKLFEIVLIVTTQPKDVISIENKGKKGNQNYCTKKTQPFTTKVRILSGECFQNFEIQKSEIELVAEKDLVPGAKRSEGQPCLKVQSQHGQMSDISYTIEVKNFKRVEQNIVYKQFFRILYTVEVSVDGTLYLLQTMSLPFTFNTGANQMLEHKGARMWYCSNAPDLYNGQFQCPDPLPVKDVIVMLENRIACQSKNARRLTDEEKEFLESRLPVINGKMVSMQGFLKDKLKTQRLEDTLPFSFYTWFYAVVNTIDNFLDAWLDRIIYGFSSYNTAEKLLMPVHIPEGTFILRPSVSVVKNTSSLEAAAALTLEVKVQKECAHPFDVHDAEFEVQSIPLTCRYIEKHTLYGAIKDVMFNNIPAAKYVYDSSNNGRKLEVLKGYGKKKPKETYFRDYAILMEKFGKLNFKPMPKTTQETEQTLVKEEVSGQAVSIRKRRKRQSPTCMQATSPSQSSSASAGIDEASGFSPLPAFIEITTGTAKQTFYQMESTSQAAVSEQCQGQRSGSQGKETLDTTNAMAVCGSREGNSSSTSEQQYEIVLGSNVIDVSHIYSSAPVDCCSPYEDQGDQTLTQPTSVDISTISKFHNSPAGLSGYDNTAINWRSSSNISCDSEASPFLMLNMASNNVPTVVNDVIESHELPRGQGRGRGKGTSGRTSKKKSPHLLGFEKKSQTCSPVNWQNSTQTLHLICQDIQNQNCVNVNQTSYMVNGSNCEPAVVTVSNGTSMYNTFSTEIMDIEQLTACIEEQMSEQLSPESEQLSPDSGVEDQSHSPDNSKTDPFLYLK